jgi:hypothetical protein
MDLLRLYSDFLSLISRALKHEQRGTYSTLLQTSPLGGAPYFNKRCSVNTITIVLA